MTFAFSLDAVTKEYLGGVVALRDVSIEVPQGEQLAWWGRPARARRLC